MERWCRELAPRSTRLKSQAALSTKRARPDNYDWATLLRRVFEIDITACRDCGGNMRPISVITSPTVIKKILDHVGLPSSPPDIEPRGPPENQLELLWEDDNHVA